MMRRQDAPEEDAAGDVVDEGQGSIRVPCQIPCRSWLAGAAAGVVVGRWEWRGKVRGRLRACGRQRRSAAGRRSRIERRKPATGASDLWVFACPRRYHGSGSVCVHLVARLKGAERVEDVGGRAAAIAHGTVSAGRLRGCLPKVATHGFAHLTPQASRGDRTRKRPFPGCAPSSTGRCASAYAEQCVLAQCWPLLSADTRGGCQGECNRQCTAQCPSHLADAQCRSVCQRQCAGKCGRRGQGPAPAVHSGL